MRFRLPLRGDPRTGDEELPVPRDDRGRYRARGWTAAFAVGLLVWAAIAGAIVLVVSLLR
jgi:hypothetical protein